MVKFSSKLMNLMTQNYAWNVQCHLNIEWVTLATEETCSDRRKLLTLGAKFLNSLRNGVDGSLTVTVAYNPYGRAWGK